MTKHASRSKTECCTVPVHYIDGDVDHLPIGYIDPAGLTPNSEIEIIARKRGDGSPSNPYVADVRRSDGEWLVVICE